jgi:hypothetical protein
MDDFWGPFLFGAGWLALAAAFYWLLKRPREQVVSLRGRLSRGLAWTITELALATFITGLPFSLGFCRGGFDDPLTCSYLPVRLVEAIGSLSLLLAVAGTVLVPIFAGAILLIEALGRRRA